MSNQAEFKQKTQMALRRHNDAEKERRVVVTGQHTRVDFSPRPLERRFYHHYKGGLYYVHGIGVHTETGEELVMYQHVGGKFYARPMTSWRQPASVNRPPPIHRSQMYVERFRLLPEDFKMVP